MGISTLQSYCGAQIFEAVGLDNGIRRQLLHAHGVADRRRRHRRDRRGSQPAAPQAFPTRRRRDADLDWGGEYQWRRDGEYHLFNPDTVFKLQHATRSGQYRDLQGIHEAGRRSEPRTSRRCAACSS